MKFSTFSKRTDDQILKETEMGPEMELQIEKIYEEKEQDGKRMVRIKWRNFHEAHNEWVSCESHFYSEYLQKVRSKKQARNEKRKVKSEKLPSVTLAYNHPSPKRRGFQHGRRPELIVGVTKFPNDRLGLIIKWEEYDWVDIVPSKVMNQKYPEMVIKFYQEKLSSYIHDDFDLLK